MNRTRDLRTADNWRRLLTAGCAVLIFALGLFAVSPLLHEQLHHDGHIPADDGCAIVLFAGGVSMPLDLPRIAPPAVEWHGQPFVVAREIFRTAPRYLLQPAHGPPLA